MKEFEGDKGKPKKPPPERPATEKPATDKAPSEKAEVAKPAETPAVSQAAPSPRRRSFLHVTDLQLKFLPILWMVLAVIGMQVFASVVVDELFRYVPMPGRLHYKWMSDGYDSLGLMALALLVIFILRWRTRGDFGLHLPRGKWYLASAIFWGLVFGAVAAAIEYNGKLVSQIAPHWQARFPSATNIIGWIAIQGLVIGPSQEVFYRGLLSTYLGNRVAGQVGLGRFELSVGSFLVALVVALTYIWNFVAFNGWLTTAMIFYVLVSGTFFAYWFEKSKSLLASVVGHSLVGMTEYALIFVLIAMQR